MPSARVTVTEPARRGGDSASARYCENASAASSNTAITARSLTGQDDVSVCRISTVLLSFAQTAPGQSMSQSRPDFPAASYTK